MLGPFRGKRAQAPSGSLRLGLVFVSSLALGGCASALRVQECEANPAQELLVEINAARAEEGVPPVLPNPLLARAASGHARALAEGRAAGHFGDDGSDPLTRITDAGYLPTAFGENTATGSSAPERIVAAWLASPGHRMVLLDPSYKEVGLGGVLDARRPVWVADFGTRREAAAVRCHAWDEVVDP